ncbi:MAG: EVE domain-containing protein [Alkalinema sp. CACIAM 70d]|nr:MAG: EVE domain-containing protein [Alkalinema sp. CACIAM 70d]
MAYWLMKSEPDVYGIDDLQTENIGLWDGVRNYQARNFLKSMQVGDLAFFYHSNTKPPGIAGLMKIVETQVVDPTQFDLANPYYDPKSTPEAPRWHTVKCQYVETLPELITLEQLKAVFSPDELLVVRPGNRLSVMPVETPVAQRILQLGAFQTTP